jgi:hypothetical protein
MDAAIYFYHKENPHFTNQSEWVTREDYEKLQKKLEELRGVLKELKTNERRIEMSGNYYQMTYNWKLHDKLMEALKGKTK